MAGGQREDEDHLIVIDPLLNQIAKTNASETDFVMQPPSLARFNSTQLQQQKYFKQVLVAEVARQQQILKDIVLDTAVEHVESDRRQSFQSAIPIEEVDSIADMLGRPSIAMAMRKNDTFEISGHETKPEMIIEAYRALVTALNAFNSAEQKQFRHQQLEKFTTLQTALGQARETNDLVRYATSYHALKSYTQSADYLALNSSMVMMTQSQQEYLSLTIRGAKFHRENSDRELDKINANVLERQNTAMSQGLLAESSKTKEETIRLYQLKKAEEHYKQAFVPHIIALQVGEFKLDAKNNNCLQEFNSELTTATTAITHNKQAYKFSEIQAVTHARILLANIKRCSDDASTYIKERLIDPKKYLDDLKKPPIEELIILQKQQLEIAQVQVIAYRKNFHAAQQSLIEQVGQSFTNITTAASLSENDLVTKLAKLKALKKVLTESIIVSKQETEKFIEQHEKQKSIINHKCFVEITDNKDKDEVLAFIAQAIKEAHAIQENQRALLIAIMEEENLCFTEFDQFRAKLPEIYDHDYYHQNNVDYGIKCDAAVNVMRQIASHGFHYPIENYDQLITAKADQETLMQELKAFIHGLDENIDHLQQHLAVIEKNFPDKTALIEQLADQGRHLKSMKAALVEKQDQAINAYIYTTKMTADLASFYLNDAQLGFNALDVDALFDAAKSTASFNYLLGKDSDLHPLAMDDFQLQAKQKIDAIEKLQKQLEQLPNLATTLATRRENLVKQLTKAHEQLSLLLEPNKASILDYDSVKVETPNFTTLAQRDQAVLDFKALLLRDSAEINLIKYSAEFFTEDESFLKETYQVLVQQQHRLTMEPPPEALRDLLQQRVCADVLVSATADLAAVKIERWIQLLNLADTADNKDLSYAIYCGLKQTLSGNELFLKNLSQASQDIVKRMDQKLAKHTMLGENPIQAGDELWVTENSLLEAELFPDVNLLSPTAQQHLVAITTALRQEQGAIEVAEGIDAWCNYTVAQLDAAQVEKITHKTSATVFEPLEKIHQQLAIVVSATVLAESQTEVRNKMLASWVAVLQALMNRGNLHAVDSILQAFKQTALRDLVKARAIPEAIMDGLALINEYCKRFSSKPLESLDVTCPVFSKLKSNLDALHQQHHTVEQQLSSVKQAIASLVIAMHRDNGRLDCPLLSQVNIEKVSAWLQTNIERFVKKIAKYRDAVNTDSVESSLRATSRLQHYQALLSHYQTKQDTLNGTATHSGECLEALLAVYKLQEKLFSHALTKTEAQIHNIVQPMRETLLKTQALPLTPSPLVAHFAALPMELTGQQRSQFSALAKQHLDFQSAKTQTSTLLQQSSTVYSDGMMLSYRQGATKSLFSKEANQVLIKNPVLYQLIVANKWMLNANATLADYEALNRCFLKTPTLSELKTSLASIVINKIPSQDLMKIHAANKQHVYHDALENNLLKNYVKDQIVKSTSFLRHFSPFSASYGTAAKIAALNEAIVQPVSDAQFQTLLADTGIKLSPEQLTQVQAENRALAASRALITMQTTDLSRSPPIDADSPEASRLQRWTQHAKDHPVKSALLAVSACVLFKPVLVSAVVMGVVEAFKPPQESPRMRQ